MKIPNNYRFRLVLVLTVLLSGSTLILAQSSCSCESESCRASQSCPEGYLATCTCGDYCSSQCKKANSELPEMWFENGSQSLIKTVMESDEKRISEDFSKNIGREVIFVKSPKIQRLAIDASSFKSYWDIAEFLANNGKITINRLPFEIWKGNRDTLLKGGEYKICANDLPAEMILDEINFLTGRNFRIVSGDPKSKAKVVVLGKGLKEVLDSLSASRNIIIQESK
jgi:hypothetical protein